MSAESDSVVAQLKPETNEVEIKRLKNEIEKHLKTITRLKEDNQAHVETMQRMFALMYRIRLSTSIPVNVRVEITGFGEEVSSALSIEVSELLSKLGFLKARGGRPVFSLKPREE